MGVGWVCGVSAYYLEHVDEMRVTDIHQLLQSALLNATPQRRLQISAPLPLFVGEGVPAGMKIKHPFRCHRCGKMGLVFTTRALGYA
jgi:hypothetical protein